MQIEEIYDTTGQDGIENKAAFEKMPKVLQYFISSQQKLLCNRVLAAVKRKFGEAGLASVNKSSGFRAQSVNSRHNGVPDSLHLWGCAADFLKLGIFKKMPIPVCDQLQVIDSGSCWHVQFKRGL